MQNSQCPVKRFQSSLFCTLAIFFLSLALSSCQSSSVKRDSQTPISQTEPEGVSIQPQTTANHRLKSYGIAGNILFGDTASFNSQLCEGKKVGKPQVSLTIIGEILECGHDSKPI